MKKLFYILLGILAAPAVAVFLVSIWSLLTATGSFTDISDVIIFGLFLYVFALGFTIVLALPAFALVYYLYGVVEWWLAAIGGMLVGICSVLIILIPWSTDKLSQNVGAILIYAVVGFISGFVFWTFLRIGGAQKREMSSSDSR